MSADYSADTREGITCVPNSREVVIDTWILAAKLLISVS